MQDLPTKESNLIIIGSGELVITGLLQALVRQAEGNLINLQQC